jgi:hypothetical protein
VHRGRLLSLWLSVSIVSFLFSDDFRYLGDLQWVMGWHDLDV